MADRLIAYWFGRRLVAALHRQRVPGSFFLDDDEQRRFLNRAERIGQRTRLKHLLRLPVHPAGWMGYSKN